MAVAVLDVGGNEDGGKYFLNYNDYKWPMMLDWMEHNVHCFIRLSINRRTHNIHCSLYRTKWKEQNT